MIGWQVGYNLGVSTPKIGGTKPKMDGENHGSNPYEQMDDLRGFKPLFLEIPIYDLGCSSQV